jgi:hypothetical protein
VLEGVPDYVGITLEVHLRDYPGLIRAHGLRAESELVRYDADALSPGQHQQGKVQLLISRQRLCIDLLHDIERHV